VTAAMFHLFTHAFFKALLFLGSGSVIHATHQQTVEEMGGLRRKLPITSATFIIGGLALAGVPIFAGFWSKDEIMHALLHDGPIVSFVVLALTALLTAVYTGRLIFLTFFGEPRNHHAYDHAHESGPAMALPLIVLATLSVVAGFFVFDVVGEALGFVGGIGSLIFLDAPHGFAFDNIDWALAGSFTALALAGLGVAWVYWGGRAERAAQARAWTPELHALLVNRYYMDHLYQAIIDRAVLGLASAVAWFDKRVVNESGIDGSAQIVNYMGHRLRFLQTGRIPNYALAMATGVVVLAVIALGS
jgi:NADH-quinone oxidoreductase subunit L